MHRPRFATLAIIALTFASIAGCTRSPEYSVIDKYFDASRMRDNTTLANIAMVSFNPNEQGVVQSFEVTNVSEEQRRPLRIRELSDAYQKARAADEAFTKQKKEYQDKNLEAIDRVLKAEREGRAVGGRDGEVQKAWAKWREDTATHARAVNDARVALDAERGVAELSVFDARRQIDLAQYSGELISKDVTMNARIRTPDGSQAQKAMVVTIQRADVKNDQGDQRNGRWIITSIKDASAAATTP